MNTNCKEICHQTNSKLSFWDKQKIRAKNSPLSALGGLTGSLMTVTGACILAHDTYELQGMNDAFKGAEDKLYLFKFGAGIREIFGNFYDSISAPVKNISSYIKNSKNYQKGGALIFGLSVLTCLLHRIAGEVKSRKEIKKEENNIT